MVQWKNQITRALGLEGHSTTDVATFEAKRGDVYLLCSDGLGLDPESACRDLVRAAFEAGSHDNITGLVVRCE